jgi:DNA polymerase-3 subunit delta'
VELERPLTHDGVVEGLWRAARGGRLPHALSFEGRRGTGRFLAAEWLAAGLLCDAGPGAPCGACGPCKRVASDNHADLFVLDAQALGAELIPVDAIVRREGGKWPAEPIEDFLRLRALESPWRLVLVREAERMNTSAQNALLKTLEEPAPGTLLLLETSRPDRLLATIRSRCVRVRFADLPAAEATRVLLDHGLEPTGAERLARWSGGAPGEALGLAARGGEEMAQLLLDALRGAVRPLVASRGLFELEGKFVGERPTQRARDRVRTVVELALGLAGDLLRCTVGVPPSVVGFGAELEAAYAGQWPPETAVAAMIDALLAVRVDVDRNVTPEALLDRTALSLGDLAALGSGARA